MRRTMWSGVGRAAVIGAGLVALLASDALAQTVRTSRSHVGRFEYELTFDITNTASSPICAVEAQLISHFDDIIDKEAPANWSAGGPQNGAIDYVARSTADCIPGGGVKGGFGLTLAGVLPATVEMCFLGNVAGGQRPLVGKCVSLSIK